MPGKESYASFDLIYVLDDPPKRRELEDLAESIHARFGIPFRIVLLDKNMGFAPANNVGLRYAVGEFLCYLNSDVFPDTPQWMERLSARLEANPDIGAVGPLLLFEDGSVQHEGMTFERMPIFGNIPFPMHSRKGLRPRSNPGLERVPAITGACMVLRRELARELGGFDESLSPTARQEPDVRGRPGRENVSS
jgi:GT2 family glycosyltransferase